MGDLFRLIVLVIGFVVLFLRGKGNFFFFLLFLDESGWLVKFLIFFFVILLGVSNEFCIMWLILCDLKRRLV